MGLVFIQIVKNNFSFFNGDCFFLSSQPTKIVLISTLKVVEQKLTLNSPIEEFLTKIGLGQHAEKLKQKGYATVKHFEYLNEDTSVDLFFPIKQEILLEYVTN